MSVDICAGDSFRFDLRHVTSHALTSGTAAFMMRVFFNGGRMRAVRGHRAVTIQANLIRRLSQLGVVLRAMHIMAGGTGDSMPVHDALHKVIALHPVFVRRAVWKIVKVRLPERAVFQLPEIL